MNIHERQSKIQKLVEIDKTFNFVSIYAGIELLMCQKLYLDYYVTISTCVYEVAFSYFNNYCVISLVTMSTNATTICPYIYNTRVTSGDQRMVNQWYTNGGC